MAVNFGQDAGKQKSSVDASNANGVNVENGLNNQSVDNNKGLSSEDNYFNMLRHGLISQGSISASLSDIKKRADEIIEAKRHNVKTLVLDKSVLTNLGYSSIVYYKNYPNKNLIRYYVCLLAGSGRKSLTAKETIRIAEFAKQDRSYNGDELYTYSDAIDKVLHGIIIDALSKETGAAKNSTAFTPLDGLIIPYDTDPLAVVEQSTVSAVNSFTVNEYLDEGKGLNIGELKRAVGDKSLFKYSIETHKEGYIPNRVGAPVRADFTAKIEIKDTNARQEVRSVNKASLDKELVQASGYITGMPVYMGNRVNEHNQPLPAWVIAPHIVITNIRTYVPDTASMLLGIVAGSLVGSQKQYIKVIMDTMTEDRHPGFYNLLTRTVVGKNGKATPINVTDLSYSPQDRAIAIDQLFNFTPIISLDAMMFGEGCDVTAPLTWCREKPEARKDVFKSAEILTNGVFKDYNGDILFSKNYIPSGTYNTKKEQRDIRDLEFEKILSLTNLEDETAVNMFLGSIEKDNRNSYNEKTELLANFIPDALIDGKIMRLTIDFNFIKTLIASVQQSGLIAQVDSAFVMPTAGFRADNLSAYSQYKLDQGFSGNITFNTNPNAGGTVNYNNYNLFSGFMA